MHEEEVAGVLLLAHSLDDAGRHGDGRDARRSDHGVDLAAREDFQGLAEEDASGRAADEGHQAQDDDLQRRRRQEGLGLHRRAHRQAQEDRRGVEDLVLGRQAQALRDAALPQEVAEHEDADEGHRRRQDEARGDGADDGEEDPLRLAHRTEVVHADGPVRLRRQGLDDRRLDERHEGHVAVGRHGNRSQDLRRQFHRQVDARRAVGPSDDGDAGRLFHREAHHHGAEEGDEDAQLGRRPQEEGDGVGQQGREVRQGSDSHEDDDGVDFVLGPEEDVVEKAPFVHDARQGQVDEDAAEGDGHQQEGLEALADGQVEQDEADDEHDEIARREAGESRLGEDARQ